MNTRISKLLKRTKNKLIDLYSGDPEIAELLLEIKVKRCVHAERDHYKDRRIYSHVGCEEMLICMSSSIDLLSDENIIGILCHEIGHLIHHDLLEDFEPEIINADDEVIADCVVDNLFGIHIYYDDNKIQWVELP